jgi:hypothetical protein
VVALEHRDEQGEREERVRAHLEQRHVVVLAQRPPLVLGEGQPRRPLGVGAVEQRAGHLGLPPLHGAGRVGAVALGQVGVAVDGVEELVQQVPAHADAPVPVGTPFGYQVK